MTARSGHGEVTVMVSLVTGLTTDSHIPVQVSGLSGMTAIAAGNNFTVALKNDGTVWAWGSNSNGQLGNATTTDSDIPVQVSGTSGLSNVIGVAAGYNHTVALTNMQRRHGLGMGK